MGVSCLMFRGNTYSDEKDNIINLQKKKSVWNKRFGEKEIQQCPLCRIIIMKKKIENRGKKNWEVAYIRDNGDDSIRNLIPICYKCNKKYRKNKRINLIDISKGKHDKTIIY